MDGVFLNRRAVDDLVIDELNKLKRDFSSGDIASLTSSLASTLPSDFSLLGEVNSLNSAIGKLCGEIENTSAFISRQVNYALNSELSSEQMTELLLESIATMQKDVVLFYVSTLADVTNIAISFVSGILKFGEALVDTGAIVATGVATPFTGLWDLGKGLFTGDWSFSTTKKMWNGTKAFVSNNYIQALKEQFYNTKAGQWLDNTSGSWLREKTKNMDGKLGKFLHDGVGNAFRSDGIACTIAEGFGYAVPIIATGGVIGATSGLSAAAGMGLTAATAGLGKYTAGEWNKNSILFTDIDGKNQAINIDYTKISEIQSLKVGQTTSIIGNGQVYKITANGNGTYSMLDNQGHTLTVTSVNESNTAKGLVVGAVKGAWDGALFYAGGKVNQFRNININGVDRTVHAGVRVGLDAATAATNVPFQSAVTAISEGKSYSEAFQQEGGWGAVATQTALGAGMSAVAEGIQAKHPKIEQIYRGDNASSGASSSEVAAGVAGAEVSGAMKVLGGSKKSAKVTGSVSDATLAKMFDDIEAGRVKAKVGAQADEAMAALSGSKGKKSIFDMTPSKEWKAEHVHRATSKVDATAGTVDNATGAAAKTTTSRLENVEALRSERETLLNQKSYTAKETQRIREIDKELADIKRAQLSAKSNAETVTSGATKEVSGNASDATIAKMFDDIEAGRVKAKVGAQADEAMAALSGSKGKKSIFDMTPSKEWEAEQVHRTTSKVDATAGTVDNATGAAAKTTTEATMTTGVGEGTVTGTKINEVELKPDAPLQAEGIPKNTVTGEKIVPEAEQAKTTLTSEKLQRVKDLVATKENGTTKIDVLEQDIKSLESKAAGMNKFERAEINKEIELKRSQIERLQKQVNTADAELNTKLKDIELDNTAKKTLDLVATKENGTTKIDVLEQDIKSLESKAAGMNKFERAEINKEIELKRSQIERLQKQVNTADAELKDIKIAQKQKMSIEETSEFKEIKANNNNNNTTSTKGMTLDKWEDKIYGGKLNRTKEGYEEAIAARDKLIKEKEILLAKIENKTATSAEIEYVSSGRIEKQIMQNNRAINAIEHTMNRPYSDIEAIESDRVFSVKNSVVDGSNTLLQITKENALHTDSNHVYRITGNNQLNDIINTGYVRPRGTKAKGSGALNQVYWTSGHERVNYDLAEGLSNKVILEVPVDKLANDQIGAISIDDLSAIWKYDKQTGKNINIIDEIRQLYANKK